MGTQTPQGGNNDENPQTGHQPPFNAGADGRRCRDFRDPWVARAQAKTIKVGMPTILSGRVAQLGTSSRNA